MSIAGVLEYSSNLVSACIRDAEAVDRLVGSLGALQGFGGTGDPFKESTAGAKGLASALAKAQSALDVQALKGSQAADLVQQKANAAADLASQKGAQAAVLAAQQAEAKLAEIAAQGTQAKALEAQKAEAKIAELAAKGEQDRLAAADKGSAAQELAAQKAEAQLEAIAAKGAEARATIAAKEAADQAKIASKNEADAEKAADRDAKAAEKRAEKAQEKAEKQTAKDEEDLTKRLDADREAYDKAMAARAKTAEQAAEKSRSAWAKSGVDNQNAQAQSDKEDEGRTAGQIESAAQAVLAAVEKLAALAFDLVKAGIDLSMASGSFREDTTIAFEGLLGGEAAAAALYEKALTLADAVGLSKEAVVAKLQKQISAGVAEADAIKEIHAIAAATIGLGEGKASKIDSLLTKIAASDKVGARVFDSLAVAGLSTDELYAKLGATTGKTRKELEAMAKAGTLASAQVTDAIESVIEGKWGAALEKLDGTLVNTLADIPAQFERLFDQVTGTAGADKLKDLLAGFSGMITGPEGEKLRSAFNELFGNLFGLFGDSVDLKAAGEVVDEIAAGIHRVGVFVKDITPGVSGFFKGFVEGFDKWVPIMGAAADAFLSLMGSLGGMGGFWNKAGEGVGFLIGFLVTLVTVIVEVVAAIVALAVTLSSLFFVVLGYWSDFLSWLGGTGDAISDFFSNIGDSITGAGDSLATSALDVGDNIMQSMADGITGKAGAVADAVIGAAKNAIQAAKRILGIASPSKVFRNDIGGNAGDSMAMGFDDKADAVAYAARSMAQDAASASASVGMMGPVVGLAGGAANANGAGGRDGVTGSTSSGIVMHVAAGAVVIQIGAGASASAGGDAALAEAIERRIDAYFHRFAEQA